MARPLDLDLRERVVAAVSSEQSCRAVAKTFGVSVSSVVKWSQRFRATGSVAPCKMGGHRPYVLEAERGWLLARLQEQPDITMRALADELADRGIIVSHVSVWNLIRRENQTHKKKPPRQRAGSP